MNFGFTALALIFRLNFCLSLRLAEGRKSATPLPAV